MKVIGIGLNRTGTKSLRACLINMGYQHQSYDLNSFHQYRRGDVDGLLNTVETFESFEDWPWPLVYREIDQRFPDARFILTTRKNPEKWYQSLCALAVRYGPLDAFEEHIYGYKMPHGHKTEHLRFYAEHNQAVRKYFKDRPEKLLEICWEEGDNWSTVAQFLGRDSPEQQETVHNRTRGAIYSGDNRIIAELFRIGYQAYKRAGRKPFKPWDTALVYSESDTP